MSFITTLTFVKKTKETDDIYTFSFTPRRPLKHTAGQHGLFILPGLYRPHPFTLSSAPEEEFVTFSTHTATGSAFKKRIMQFQPGDKMFLIGPMLTFTLRKNTKNHVFLAQGIGVTPFRSMLIHAQQVQLPDSIRLIHVDTAEHAFRAITEPRATAAFYPKTKEEFQELVQKENPNQLFYISGNPKFNSTTKQLLKDMGVSREHMKTDSFWGY